MVIHKTIVDLVSLHFILKDEVPRLGINLKLYLSLFFIQTIVFSYHNVNVHTLGSHFHFTQLFSGVHVWTMVKQFQFLPAIVFHFNSSFDSLYIHVFSTPIHFPYLISLSICIFSRSEADQFSLNLTLFSII
jgi:hypothetical protein